MEKPVEEKIIRENDDRGRHTTTNRKLIIEDK